MQSMLKELYMGNVGFDAGYYPQNSPFVKAARKKLDDMEQLNAMLDDKGKELFEQYCDAQGDIESITRYGTYTNALTFGILLMVEVFTSIHNDAGERVVREE